MKKKAISHFIIGVMISFTIEILVMTFAVLFGGGDTLPVSMNLQAFGLALCCSVVGTIFSSDKLSFRLQAAFTYVFSLLTVLTFSHLFHWDAESNGFFKGFSFHIIVIVLFTTGYTITMIFTWAYQRKVKKKMNDKLADYQQKARTTQTE